MDSNSFDEFYKSINNLMNYSFTISSSSKLLADAINEAYIQKQNLEEKEKVLGLENLKVLYGATEKENSLEDTLLYTKNSSIISAIQEFIKTLENYHTLENDEKKRKLHEIKEQITDLREQDVKPEHFIINQTRYDIWNMVENDFSLTLKKLHINSFLSQINFLKSKYKHEITTIKEYYKNRENIFSTIHNLRKNEVMSQEEVNKQITAQYDLLNEQLDPNIAPLLIETGTLLNRLEYKLEEIPEELNSTQKKEFEEFIPAISEYYIDQSYALSQGESYSPLSSRLEKIQKLIDQPAFIGNILHEIDTLDSTIEHLYLLHWIAESVLKIILKCFRFSCSIGRTARAYSYNSSTQTATNIKSIDPAIKVRNDVAHNGLIWSPKKISLAISTYRKYINDIAKEQKLNLFKIVIQKEHRKISKKEKEKRTQEFVKQHFNYDAKNLQQLNAKVYEKLSKRLEENFWFLSDKDKEIFSNSIKREEKDLFANKFFHLTYKEVEEKLITHYKAKYGTYNSANEDDRKKAKINTLYWAFKSYEKSSIANAVSDIKKYIGQ